MSTNRDGYGMKVCTARDRGWRDFNHEIENDDIFILGDWKSDKLNGDHCIIFKSKQGCGNIAEMDTKKKEQKDVKNINVDNNDKNMFHGKNDLISNLCDENRIKTYQTIIIGKFKNGAFVSGDIYHYKRSHSTKNETSMFTKRTKQKKDNNSKNKNNSNIGIDKLSNKNTLILEKLKKIDWGVQHSDHCGTLIGDCTIWHGRFEAMMVRRYMLYQTSDETKPLVEVDEMAFKQMNNEQKCMYQVKEVSVEHGRLFRGRIDFLNDKKMSGVFDFSHFKRIVRTPDDYKLLFVEGSNDVSLMSGSILWDNIFFKIDCRVSKRGGHDLCDGIVIFKDIKKECETNNSNSKNNNNNNNNCSSDDSNDFDMNSDESMDTSVDSNSHDDDNNQFDLKCNIMKRRYHYHTKWLSPGFTYIGSLTIPRWLQPTNMGLIMKNNDRFCRFDQCYKQRNTKYILKSKLVKKIIDHKNRIKKLLNENNNNNNMNIGDILCYTHFSDGSIFFPEYFRQYMNMNNLEVSMMYMKYIINKINNNFEMPWFCGYDNNTWYHRMATISNFTDCKQKEKKEISITNGLKTLIDFFNEFLDKKVQITVSREDKRCIQSWLTCNNSAWMDYVLCNIKKDKKLHDFRVSGWTTLHYCCCYNYKTLFDRCIGSIIASIKTDQTKKDEIVKKSILCKTTKHKLLPIHIAAIHGRYYMVSKLLLNFNTDNIMFEATTKDSWCAAALSIIHGHVDCFKSFYNNGFKPDIMKNNIVGFNGFSIVELCFAS